MNHFTSKTDYDRWIEANTYTFDAHKAFWDISVTVINYIKRH